MYTSATTRRMRRKGSGQEPNLALCKPADQLNVPISGSRCNGSGVYIYILHPPKMSVNHIFMAFKGLNLVVIGGHWFLQNVPKSGLGEAVDSSDYCLVCLAMH